jgi:hypothetical protein
MGSMGKKTTRVQLELASTSFDRLKRLQVKTEASSHSAVIREALRLYEGLLSEAGRGNFVAIREKNGDETIYRMIFNADGDVVI